jgi:SAM-dependent methyltransferase
MESSGMLRRLFAHPLLRDLDLDDPITTRLRRDVIASNPFLSQIYAEWYALLKASLPAGHGRVLELGSGPGFLSAHIPELITSETFFVENIHIILDGQSLPFHTGVLKAIVITNVFHHIPCPVKFLNEAARVIRPGGVISMIEPWNTTWSRFVYSHLHHEAFDDQTLGWEIRSTGPLSGANGALPWIIFQRDRQKFEHDFPAWRVEKITPFMPLAYLISGGVSMRPLMPGWSYPIIHTFERGLRPIMPYAAMFSHILLARNEAK